MSRFKTRARMRAANDARNGSPEAATSKARPLRAGRGVDPRKSLRTELTVSKWRIAMNVALLLCSIGGAALQLIEASRHVPGEHRLWLSVYLFVAVFAAYSLTARLKQRKKEFAPPKARVRASGAARPRS